jgi:hypothetical protein
MAEERICSGTEAVTEHLAAEVGLEVEALARRGDVLVMVAVVGVGLGGGHGGGLRLRVGDNGREGLGGHFGRCVAKRGLENTEMMLWEDVP